MGLDAVVYCNCYETGKAVPPAQPELVYVEDSGAIDFRWEQAGPNQSLLEQWLAQGCEHGLRFQLITRRLGNISQISALHTMLSKFAESFPMLLGKVLYDGAHTGDYIAANEVARLATELEHLLYVKGRTADDENALRDFERQMRELVLASQSVAKPIAF